MVKSTSADVLQALLALKRKGDASLLVRITVMWWTAPASKTGNEIDHYLGKWNEVLWEVYPDYVISGGNTLLGGAVALDVANENFLAISIGIAC